MRSRRHPTASRIQRKYEKLFKLLNDAEKKEAEITPETPTVNQPKKKTEKVERNRKHVISAHKIFKDELQALRQKVLDMEALGTELQNE